MNVLALIAHPDDLEIAAAGTICQLAEAQHRVFIGVVTDEANNSTCKIRQQEALRAAETIGVPSSRVLFLGQEDRFATNDEHARRVLKAWLASHDCRPDLVITHSRNDNHQDHRAVHELAMAATREYASLYLFAAVINSLRKEIFHPDVFVDTSAHWARKKQALSCYPSQDILGRIRVRDIDQHERRYATPLGVNRVEAFEAHYAHPIKAARLLRQFALKPALKKKTTDWGSIVGNPVWQPQPAGLYNRA